MDKLDKTLWRVRLRKSALDQAAYSTKGELKMPDVGELFGIEPFSSVAGLVSVVRENYPIKPFMSLKCWTKYRSMSIALLQILKKPFITLKPVILFP